MSRIHFLFGLVLVGLVARPWLAAADEVYSYQDEEGVLHFSNAPSDARYHRVHRSGGATLYRKSEPQARARPLEAGGSSAAPASNSKLERFRAEVRAAAEKYRLPEKLLLAVMSIESNCDHRALSDKGAMGLMQLMPGTAHEMYVDDAWDPAQNIEGGARYLRHLQDQFGNDLEKVLAAYNAGPEAVRRSGGEVPPFPETRAYVKKVLALYQAYLGGH
jgi:soluble lytic murein transglycosylase-like protein